MSLLTTKVARWLYALPFGVFGLMHFMAGNDMTGYIPGFIPGGVFWIYLTGAALIAACISFVIEKQVRLAGSLLALMLLIFVLTIHVPGMMADSPEMAQMAMTSLLKDLALAGGALLLAGQYPSEATPGE